VREHAGQLQVLYGRRVRVATDVVEEGCSQRRADVPILNISSRVNNALEGQACEVVDAYSMVEAGVFGSRKGERSEA
jgi:hypothetical protein